MTFHHHFSILAISLALLFGAHPALGFSLAETGQWQTQNETLTPLAHADGVVFASGDRTLEAWDVDRGKRLWKTDLPSPANFRPRLSENVVIASGREHLGVFDRKTGKRLWQYEKQTQIAVPLIMDNTVFFGDGGQFIALNLKDGSERWSHTIKGGAEIFYGAVGHKGTVYLGAGDGLVYAFEAANGAVKWTFDNEENWQYLRQLFMAGDTIIAGGYHDEVFAVRTGEHSPQDRIQWHFYAGNFINSQLVHDQSVYFWSPTGWVYALDAQTGKRNWRHSTHKFASYNSDWGPVMAELKAYDDTILILDMKRVLHVLSSNTGEKEAEPKLGFAPRPFVLPISEKQLLLFADLQGSIRVQTVSR